MEAIIGAGSVMFGMIITYFTFVRNRDKDIKHDATKDAKVSTKLDYISTGVDDMRIELRANQKEMSRMNEQIIRVDESTKSAHKRIDKLEGVRNHD